MQNQIQEAEGKIRFLDASAFYPDCQRLLMFQFEEKEKKKKTSTQKTIFQQEIYYKTTKQLHFKKSILMKMYRDVWYSLQEALIILSQTWWDLIVVINAFCVINSNEDTHFYLPV